MDTASEHSWFLELEKYSETDARRQRENFFTTAFVWTLDECPELKARVLKYLFGDEFEAVDFSIAELSTQAKNDDGKIPDITVTVSLVGEAVSFKGAIECKIDAAHDKEDKVNGYRETLLRDHPSVPVGLAYISKYRKEPAYQHAICYRWEDVYKEMVKADCGSALLDELCVFMREIGMADMRPLKVGDVSVIPAFRDFIDAAARLVEAVCGRVVDEISGLERGNFERDKRPCYCGRRLIYDGSKFGVYLYFPGDELAAMLYLTQPGPNAEPVESNQFARCKDKGWIPHEENGFRGLKCSRSLSAKSPGQPISDKDFVGQVDWVAEWAIGELRKVIPVSGKIASE